MLRHKYLISDATTIGLEQNAIKNRATRVAPSMASVKMAPAYAVKDGTEDIAHYVRKVANCGLKKYNAVPSYFSPERVSCYR